MADYSKTRITDGKRTELHDVLSLTGAEISINILEPGTGTPFVHAHRKNEEIYGVVGGRGKIVLDGEDVSLEKGDWLRVDPCVKRQIFSASDSALEYICIQAKAGSLEGFTMNDGFLC